MTRPKNTRKCTFCKGTGRDYTLGGLKGAACSDCHGRGWLPYDFCLIIGADPGSATKPDVYAWWHRGQPNIMVGNFMLGKPEDEEERRYEFKPGERVLLVVEKSHAAIPRFYVHRNAAEGVVKRARAIWGRRLIVVKVDPKRWMRDLGINDLATSATGSKHWAIWYCKNYLNYDPPDDDHADSRLIYEWGRHQADAYQRGLPNAITEG